MFIYALNFSFKIVLRVSSRKSSEIFPLRGLFFSFMLNMDVLSNSQELISFVSIKSRIFNLILYVFEQYPENFAFQLFITLQ